MKHISVHWQRKSHFLKSSTFLNFRCPKWNVRNVIFIRFKFCSSSQITNVETMYGDFLWYVLINHRKFLPGSLQNTNTIEVSRVSLCLFVTNAFSDFTRGFDNLWFIITLFIILKILMIYNRIQTHKRFKRTFIYYDIDTKQRLTVKRLKTMKNEMTYLLFG